MADAALEVRGDRAGWSGVDRLGLRVAEMINSPIAQLRRAVTIHRLDTDSEEAWEKVMEMLAETDGLEMILNDDGTIGLRWGMLPEVVEAIADRERAEARECVDNEY